MIVFNLTCADEHNFDGWFRSSEEFDRQARAGLVECPLCASRTITKKLSAPRINTGATELTPREAPSQTPPQAPQSVRAGEVMPAAILPALQEHMLQQFKAFVQANTENVGTAFAETARRMHYGEESHRNIRGRVSMEDAIELREEGIETVSLPPGIVLDDSAH